MLMLISRGPYRDIARIILGAILLIIGVLVQATNAHYVLIAAGVLLILAGAGSTLVRLRKGRQASPDERR
jgi:hypothetical protein